MLKFIFGNEYDTYYLDSFLGLSMQEYMAYRCRKNGCTGIYYLSSTLQGSQIHYSLRCADENSRRLRSRYRKKGLWESLLGSDAAREEFTADNISDFYNSQMLPLLQGCREKLAFIFTLEAFCESLHTNRELLELLIREEKRNDSHFCIILQISQTAGHELRYLLSRDSIFRYTGTEFESPMPLSAGFYHLLQENTALFEAMDDYIADDCCFLNRFTRKNIARVVRRAAFADCGRALSQRTYEDCCELLFAYYQSREVRQDCGNFMGKNEQHSFRTLKNTLCELRIWNQLMAYCEKMRGENTQDSMRTILMKQYYIPDKAKLSVWADDQLTHQIKTIDLPEELRTERRELFTRLDAVLENLMKPRTVPLSEETGQILVQDVIMPLRTALDSSGFGAAEHTHIDTKTADCICRALEFGEHRNYCFVQDTDAERWNNWRELIRFSQQIFEKRQELERLNSSIRKIKQQIAALVRQTLELDLTPEEKSLMQETPSSAWSERQEQYSRNAAEYKNCKDTLMMKQEVAAQLEESCQQETLALNTAVTSSVSICGCHPIKESIQQQIEKFTQTIHQQREAQQLSASGGMQASWVEFEALLGNER